MSASTITDKNCSEIQTAMAVSLLQLKNAHGLTYDKIGRVIEREKQSVAQYICDTTEMPATCWLKAVAQWPELQDRLIHNLDEAEKAFKARQRSLDLPMPEPEVRAA
jgi:cyanate lyase